MSITLAILAATVVLMATGKIRSDTVAMGALLCLMLFGVLTPQEALTGFSSSVIFVMAGMFVISGAIVRTGLASIISGRILGMAGKNTNTLFMLVLVLTALIGSLVSNTGTVAIMMPIVVSLSLGIDESPSRFLMPLAFMSSIGGMFTLIGNSSNIVVNDAYVRAGYPSLSLFSFFPLGAACFLFGMLVLAPITSWYLSRRKNHKEEPKAGRYSMRKLIEKYSIAQNTYLLEITRESEAAGKRLEELCFPEKYGVLVAEIIRPERPQGAFHINRLRAVRVHPVPGTVLRAGDNLRVIGSIAGATALATEAGFRVNTGNAALAREERMFSSVGICELVIMSSSLLVKRSVGESGLRQQFGITVLGIQRGNQSILEDIRNQVVQAGDSLLVQGTWENLARLEEYSMNWVVVGRPKERTGSGRLREKIPLVVAVVAVMLLLTAFNLVPVVLAVLAAALALVVGGCFKNMDEAYSTINMGTLVMLACLLPVSMAMEKSGIVAIISGRMVALSTEYGPYAALAIIYAIGSAMNIVISTTPVTFLLVPIALRIAETLGYDPLPFLIALTTAASMSFASPFSTPSNALVMSAGRYTFSDYLKVGLPLQFLMGVAMVLAIPLLYPFVKV